MQQSGEAAQAKLEAVAREINELERLCLEIDAAVGQRDWIRLDQAIADSRRAMHAMENAIAEAAPFRNAAFDKAAFARLAQIYSYRHERLKVLEQTHNELGERLRQLSRWKVYARSIGSREAPRRSSGLNIQR